jgi:hypothetical protein
MKNLIFIFSIVYLISGCSKNTISIPKKDFINHFNVKSCLKSKDCFKNAFLSTAFGADHEKTTMSSKIRKFKTNQLGIVYLTDDESKKSIIEPFLSKYLELMLTYTSIQMHSDLENPDIVVVFVKDYNTMFEDDYVTFYLKKYLGSDFDLNLFKNHYNNLCYGFTLIDKNGYIQTNINFISYDLPKRTLDRCIQEEITQGLGLQKDTILPYTLFTDFKGPKYLTKLDFELINFLYIKEIKVGMTRADISLIFDKLIKVPVK